MSSETVKLRDTASDSDNTKAHSGTKLIRRTCREQRNMSSFQLACRIKKRLSDVFPFMCLKRVCSSNEQRDSKAARHRIGL
jgi:hypothetical protein